MTKPFPQPEAQLILHLQAKQTAAFTYLYDAYAPALLGTLLRLVKNQAIAEDLLQDAFLKIWSTVDQYDPKQGRLFTWMLTITRNLAFDELRARKVQARANVYLTQHADDCSLLPHDELLLGHSLTSRLEPKYRAIVELVYYQHCTKQEIADTLKLPLGTVKTRFRVALQQLRFFFRQDIQHYHTIS